MSDFFPFRPFPIPTGTQPLSRYLPILPTGLISSWLVESLPKGSLVMDPFGSQPHLAIEAARGGFRVLVACNNPIERFLLELEVNPPGQDELQAALADLSISSKGDERLETHIRSLYLTECANCGEVIEAQAFIWERETERIQDRIYHCPACGDSGIHPASQEDVRRAGQYKKGGLNWFRAIERVTPKNDPDRIHAEEALETYTPRAVHALVSLMNALDRFPPSRQRDLQALLLAAFEQGNSLWSITTTRERPRQLRVSPFYLEKNIWHAIEESIDQWKALERPADELALSEWPTLPPESGGICLFSGPIRQLAGDWKFEEHTTIQAFLAAIPRPNQAYWSLSAWWSGWLWGQEATGPFKSVLRRRRYDWQWHSTALTAAFQSLSRLISRETPFWGSITECEPNFLASALLAADLANFEIEGVGIRQEFDQAQVRWKAFPLSYARVKNQKLSTAEELRSACQEKALSHLLERDEPANFGQLFSATLSGLIKNWDILPALPEPAMEKLTYLQGALNQALSNRDVFERLGATERSAETGHWWLSPGLQARPHELQGVSYSLADRIEVAVVQSLLKDSKRSLTQIDQLVCSKFDGLFTPDQDLIRACLHSYSQKDETSAEMWLLKPQDDPSARRADLKRISQQVKKIGEYLSLNVLESEYPEHANKAQRPVLWLDQQGKTVAVFHFLASAVFSWLITQHTISEKEGLSPMVKFKSRNILVIPGGRSGLMLFKLEQDLRLRRIIENNWRIIKFRLLHRLADNLNFEISQIDQILDLDPLANQDPQIPLI